MVDHPSGGTEWLVSPLRHVRSTTPSHAPASLTAAEYANLGYLVIRGLTQDTAFMSAVASVLDCELPVQPRSVLRCSAGYLLWQSPDEWWLVCSRVDRDQIVAALCEALKNCFSQVVDNSGGFTTLRIAGPHWAMLLRHLTPHDCESLGERECVSTVMGKASVTVVRAGANGVTLVFRRSFAQYIWDLTDRAALPYGMRFVDAAEAPDGLLSELLSPTSLGQSTSLRPEASLA